MRGHVPPWEAVKDTLEEFNEHVIQVFERMKSENPEEFARIDGEIMCAVGAFKAKKQSSEN